MANTILVGAQWGDEGKGKIIDVSPSRRTSSSAPRRQQRRPHRHHRAGKIRAPPDPFRHSARGKMCVIGNGVVHRPRRLVEEMDGLKKSGIKVTANNLLISETAHLVLPYHRASTSAREVRKGKQQDRHHQARHRPRLRRQSRPHRPARDRSGASANASRQNSRPASRKTTPSSNRSAANRFPSTRSMPSTLRPAQARHRSSPTPSCCCTRPDASRRRAFSSKARRAPFSTSITARIRSSPLPTPLPAAPAPARAFRRIAWTASSA